MTAPTKKSVVSGSILCLALSVDFTAAEAGPKNSQASDHMSQTAKDKLNSLGFSGSTKDVVKPNDPCDGPADTKGC